MSVAADGHHAQHRQQQYDKHFFHNQKLQNVLRGKIAKKS